MEITTPTNNTQSQEIILWNEPLLLHELTRTFDQRTVNKMAKLQKTANVKGKLENELNVKVEKGDSCIKTHKKFSLLKLLTLPPINLPLPTFPSHHDHHQTNSNVLSAGFLFYAFAPDSNHIYFLLGMDKYSGKWCDFGGRRDVLNDETEATCAAREMLEETMNVISITDMSAKIPFHRFPLFDYEESLKNTLKLIENRAYSYRVAINIKNRNHHRFISSSEPRIECMNEDRMKVESEQKQLRVCYVKQIRWQPQLQEIFRRVYILLKRLKDISPARDRVEYWKKLPHNLKTHPSLTVRYYQKEEEIFESHPNFNEGIKSCCKYCICGFISGDSNPNIEPHICYELQEVKDVIVKQEWLEKQQIRWWSLPRLKYVIRNGGKYKRHVFRYGFLSTLSVLIEKFSQLDNKFY